MPLEGGLVIRLVVAEDRPAFGELAAVADEDVPVEVADLVAEMTEERAVGLAHRGTPRLALRIVSLGERDGDDALVMPGQHLRAVRSLAVGQKVEDQRFRAFADGGARQVELEQRVEEAVLRGLDAAPLRGGVGPVEMGDRAVVPACGAERVRPLLRDEPVADVVPRVRAEAIAPADLGPGLPDAALAGDGIEGAQDGGFRECSRAGVRNARSECSRNRGVARSTGI